MQALPKALEAVNAFFPSGLAMKPGPFVAVVFLVVFLAYVVWQAFLKDLGDRAKEALQAGGWTPWVLIFVLPLLVCLVAGSFLVAAIMAASLLVAFLWRWRGWRRPRLRWLAAVQVVLLLLGSWLEAGVRSRLRHAENEQMRVYVVLPFPPLRGEELDRLLSLSATTRNTLEQVFGDLANVRVEPTAYSAIEDLQHWNLPVDAVRRIGEAGLEADVVLVNRAQLWSAFEEADYVSITIKMTLTESSAGEPRLKTVYRVPEEGRLADFPFIVLRASLELLAAPESRVGAILSTDEKEAVLKRILVAYEDLLDLQLDVDGELLDELETALASGAVSHERAAELLGRYPRDERQKLREVIAARAQGSLSRVFRADIDLPDELVPTAPKAAPAAADPGGAEP